MEHFSSENLAIFLLAGFSGLDFFKRGLVRLCARYKKLNSTR
jgi:hypothetical protein